MLDAFNMFHNQLRRAHLAKLIYVQPVYRKTFTALPDRQQLSPIESHRGNRLPASRRREFQPEVILTNNFLADDFEATLEQRFRKALPPRAGNPQLLGQFEVQLSMVQFTVTPQPGRIVYRGRVAGNFSRERGAECFE